MGLTNAERQKRWRLAHNPDRGQQPTFYKMRMTGPRCAEMITEPLQAMRELNPNLNAMIQSTEQMDKVLCESAKLPLKKRRKIASSAVALHDMHLQRLKAFRSDAGYGYDPMVHAFGQQPPSAPATPPPDVEEVEDESSLGSRAAMERVMAEIPKTFRGRFTTLGRYLKANPDLIRVTPQGQPIVAGRQLPSAHIIDIMRSLYIWPKTQTLPSGVREVMEALRSAGAPSYLLSNTAVRTMYQRLHEAGEQFHAETQTERATEEELEHVKSYLTRRKVNIEKRRSLRQHNIYLSRSIQLFQRLGHLRWRSRKLKSSAAFWRRLKRASLAAFRRNMFRISLLGLVVSKHRAARLVPASQDKAASLMLGVCACQGSRFAYCVCTRVRVCTHC